jgi:hypothetical protein
MLDFCASVAQCVAKVHRFVKGAFATKPHLLSTISQSTCLGENHGRDYPKIAASTLKNAKCWRNTPAHNIALSF